MSAYIVVNVNTTSPEEYEGYKKSAQETVAQYGGRYLARGGRMQILEGEWAPTRIVILAFDNYDQALAWWASEAYAPAKALRQRISSTDMILVDGYDDGYR